MTKVLATPWCEAVQLKTIRPDSCDYAGPDSETETLQKHPMMMRLTEAVEAEPDPELFNISNESVIKFCRRHSTDGMVTHPLRPYAGCGGTAVGVISGMALPIPVDGKSAVPIDLTGRWDVAYGFDTLAHVTGPTLQIVQALKYGVIRYCPRELKFFANPSWQIDPTPEAESRPVLTRLTQALAGNGVSLPEEVAEAWPARQALTVIAEEAIKALDHTRIMLGNAMATVSTTETELSCMAARLRAAETALLEPRIPPSVLAGMASLEHDVALLTVQCNQANDSLSRAHGTIEDAYTQFTTRAKAYEAKISSLEADLRQAEDDAKERDELNALVRLLNQDVTRLRRQVAAAAEREASRFKLLKRTAVTAKAVVLAPPKLGLWLISIVMTCAITTALGLLEHRLWPMQPRPTEWVGDSDPALAAHR